ncbi:hypothetical protein SCALM49S_00717 [Streptomyces californicus]
MLLPENQTARYEKFDRPIIEKKIGELTGGKAKVTYANAKQDANTQAQQVDTMITNKVDALILGSVDSKAIANSVKKAKDRPQVVAVAPRGPAPGLRSAPERPAPARSTATRSAAHPREDRAAHRPRTRPAHRPGTRHEACPAPRTPTVPLPGGAPGGTLPPFPYPFCSTPPRLPPGAASPPVRRRRRWFMCPLRPCWRCEGSPSASVPSRYSPM